MTKGITRAGIVATALQLLDEQGIHAVTARALADRLGVRAPALYWHVGSKQEILDEMATEIHRRVARQLEAELDGAGWREGLATYARVLRREYLKHRDGARTFSGARVTDLRCCARRRHCWCAGPPPASPLPTSERPARC